MKRMTEQEYYANIPPFDLHSDEVECQYYVPMFVPTLGEKITAMLETNSVPPIDPESQFYDPDDSDDVDPACDPNSSFWDTVEQSGPEAVDLYGIIDRSQAPQSTETTSVDNSPTELFDAAKSPQNADTAKTGEEA